MPSLDYYDKLIHRFYVSNAVAADKHTVNILDKLRNTDVFYVDSHGDIPEEHLNSGTMFLTNPRGETVTHCPGSKGHVCCNYITTDLYLGCTLGCSYCIMKGYLNFSPLTVYVSTQESIQAIITIAKNNPHKIIRVGTGEVGDSLQFDPLCNLSQEFITALASYPQVQFEMKTKTHFVDHLLDLPQKGNAVIAFSLNPESVRQSEEALTSTIAMRLEAAHKALNAGYKLAFHFDPIIANPTWEEEYTRLAESLKQFPPQSIQWISLGTFRYTQKLKDSMTPRPYLFSEFVPCDDGKHRYIQKVRSHIYTTMLKTLRKHCDAPVYMCMESEAVWENVYHQYPENISKLQSIFTEADGVDFHSKR